MISHQPENNHPSPRTSMEKPCKHPQVQIVAREDDVEFVECKDCGEVFEASEFKDMDIEKDLQDDADDNAEAEA
jgi:Zn ribbon nucleic-acid-binding protein